MPSKAKDLSVYCLYFTSTWYARIAQQCTGKLADTNSCQTAFSSMIICTREQTSSKVTRKWQCFSCYSAVYSGIKGEREKSTGALSLHLKKKTKNREPLYYRTQLCDSRAKCLDLSDTVWMLRYLDCELCRRIAAALYLIRVTVPAMSCVPHPRRLKKKYYI